MFCDLRVSCGIRLRSLTSQGRREYHGGELAECCEWTVERYAVALRYSKLLTRPAPLVTFDVLRPSIKRKEGQQKKPSPSTCHHEESGARALAARVGPDDATN